MSEPTLYQVDTWGTWLGEPLTELTDKMIKAGVLVPVEHDRTKAFEIIWEALSDPMADAGSVTEKVLTALGIGDNDA